MAEDELGDVDVFFGYVRYCSSTFLVHLDGDAAAVVVDGDRVVLLVDGDLDGVHRLVALLVVGGWMLLSLKSWNHSRSARRISCTALKWVIFKKPCLERS